MHELVATFMYRNVTCNQAITGAVHLDLYLYLNDDTASTVHGTSKLTRVPRLDVVLKIKIKTIFNFLQC